MRCAMRALLRISLLWVLLQCCVGSCRAQGLHLAFDSFVLDNITWFDYSHATSIVNGALQVTYDVGSNALKIINASGQMTYKEPLNLWDAQRNYTASFNTSFLLNMGPIGESASNASGGGMAFVLAARPASDSAVPAGSYGEWLGLFDPSLGGAPSEQLVAVEFDTFKDAFDPDNNHVGVDTRSIHSLTAVSLTPSGVSLNTGVTGGTNTSIWIDYNGTASLLDVYVSNANDTLSKPLDPVIAGFPIRLKDFLPQTVYVGFSASTGTISETHCVVMWSFSSDGLPPGPTQDLGLVIGLSVAGAVALLALVSLAVFLTMRRRKRRNALFLGNTDWVNLHYGPRKFAYKELRKATKGFSKDCKLGEGGFGSVYRGTLPAAKSSEGPDGTEVAVKCLSQTSKQGEAEFVSEVTIIGRLRHKNLVPLLGWCYDRWKGRLLLVYEFMPNGSLDQWLKGELNGVPTLGWERRYHVLNGLAAGLLYLHEEWEMVVVHRDIKPSNVMLDSNFNARLGDFGLARLIEVSQNSIADVQTKTIAGTPGYMAPECLETGVVNKEADIYSFGAVALELAVGRRLSTKVLHWLWSLQEQGRLAEAADQRLTCYDEEQMEVVLTLGLVCCHPVPSSRPSIRHVGQCLAASSLSSFPLPGSPSAVSSVCPFPSKPQSPR